jgi:hypothetical protein
VEPAVASLLTPWNSFYVIAGSAAGALTGLQFVVMAVGAEANLGSEGTTRAYGTPTIVHFSAVLLVSSILCAPWPWLADAAWALGATGLAGSVYTLAVLGHARRQSEYKPVLEDWIWHTALPLAAYLSLVGVALGLRVDPASTLFVAGGTSLLLLFVGIHNAWDAVTYIALRRRKKPDDEAAAKS